MTNLEKLKILKPLLNQRAVAAKLEISKPNLHGKMSGKVKQGLTEKEAILAGELLNYISEVVNESN